MIQATIGAGAQRLSRLQNRGEVVSKMLHHKTITMGSHQVIHST
jgi:hypothetical protein